MVQLTQVEMDRRVNSEAGLAKGKHDWGLNPP